MIGVYCIRNRFNMKVYIGSTLNIRARLGKHRRDLIGNVHPNEHLQRAVRLHGVDNFEFDVLEECEPSLRLVREQWWIDCFSSGNADTGYNLIPTRESQLYGAALSVYQRKGWAALSKDERRKIAKHLIEPEMKKKAQAAANIARSTPEHSELRRQIALRTVCTAATRKKNSDRLKRLWQDPDFRARRIAGLDRGREKTNAARRNSSS